MTAAELASAALATWSMTVAGASAMAIARRPPPPSPSGRDRKVRCLVVRPCAGAEASLAETLASSSSLRGATDLTILFAVAREDDPALPVARAATDALRREGLDASTLVTHARGVNQKASQLAVAIAASQPADLVVVIDSDVACATMDLDALIAPLTADATLAAVWAPVVEDAASTLADRASEAVLAGSLHAFPLLSRIDPGGMVSKVVALRAAALQEVGGFASLERVLGEDMELARRFLAAGMKVRAHPRAATSRASGRTWAATIDRYARWITVIRAQRPALLASYPAMFFATWPIVAAGSALSWGAPPLVRALSLCACALAVVARVGVALAARRASRHSLSRSLADCVLADLTLALAFVRALRAQTVSWRGRALRVDRGGTLSEVTPSAR